jgi:hypothetical protein
MGLPWVRRQIERLRQAGHETTALRLQEALDAGTLRGVVISTPHGQPAAVVQEITYP